MRRTCLSYYAPTRMYAIANRTSVHVRRNYLTVSLVGLFVAEQQGEVQPPLYLDSLKHTLGRMQTLQQSSAPSSLTAPGRHTPRFNGYRLRHSRFRSARVARTSTAVGDSDESFLPPRLPGRLRDGCQMWCGGCVEEEHPI